MGFTFNELISSESYQKQADLWAKGTIAVAFITAAYVAFFTDFSLGWHWVWVTPALLFGASLILAMPTMIVQVWLASMASKNMSFVYGESPKAINFQGKFFLFLKSIWGIVLIPLEVWIVYKFLVFVSQI